MTNSNPTMKFIDRLASLPIILISGAAEASIIMTPCPPDYTLPAHPLAQIAPQPHFKPHAVKHAVHRGGRRGVMHALHAIAGRPMCAVWAVGETNASLDGDWKYIGGGGNWDGDWGGDWDSLGDGFDGALGGADFPEVLAFDYPHHHHHHDMTPPDSPPDEPPIMPPSPPFIPPFVPPTPPIVAAPEPSTWAMILIGLATLIGLKRRKSCQ